jgi:hypothetical protein
MIPGYGVSVRAGRNTLHAGGGVDWWLAGGASPPIAVYDSVAASKAASLVNLANAGTYDATEAGTVTWSSGYWSGFSATNYLVTGVTPANGYSMIAQFSDRSTATWQEVAGSVGTTSTRFRLAPVSALNPAQRYYGYGNVNQSVASSVTAGVMAVTPTGGYYNGSSDGAISVGWTGTPVAIFIGGYNNNGAPANVYWTGKIQRVAIYDYNIAAYVASISAAMAAL